MNKRKNYFKLIFCLSLLFSKFSYSQKDEDLVGAWKITKVEVTSSANQEEKQMLGLLSRTFLKSTFHFKASHLFSFDSPDKDLATRDAIWMFDEDKKYITVVERKSKGVAGLLMGINIKFSDGKYLFLIEETPVILAVVRLTGNSKQ